MDNYWISTTHFTRLCRNLAAQTHLTLLSLLGTLLNRDFMQTISFIIR